MSIKYFRVGDIVVGNLKFNKHKRGEVVNVTGDDYTTMTDIRNNTRRYSVRWSDGSLEEGLTKRAIGNDFDFLKIPFVPEDASLFGDEVGFIVFTMDLTNPFLSDSERLSNIVFTMYLTNPFSSDSDSLSHTLKTEYRCFLSDGQKFIIEFIGNEKAKTASKILT